MPYTAACAHPFDAPRLDDAFRAGGLLIGDLPLENERKRRDAGMRMKADRRHVLRVDLEIIQEHEGLDQLAHVGRTDEPGDRPLRMTANAEPAATASMAGKARHTEVTIPPITSLLRPVAFTAATKAASSHAFMEDRSMSLTSGSAALSDAIVGLLTPIWTPTVLRTTGILKAGAAFASVRALSSTSLRACSKTRSSTFS